MNHNVYNYNVVLVLSLWLAGCIFSNHIQYCHTHADCLTGQYCPTIRAPEQPPDICRGKADIAPLKLGD